MVRDGTTAREDEDGEENEDEKQKMARILLRIVGSSIDFVAVSATPHSTELSHSSAYERV
jgi:hypothetical protein